MYYTLMYYLDAEYLHSELMNKLIVEDTSSRQRNRGCPSSTIEETMTGLNRCATPVAYTRLFIPASVNFQNKQRGGSTCLAISNNGKQFLATDKEQPLRLADDPGRRHTFPCRCVTYVSLACLSTGQMQEKEARDLLTRTND